MKLLPTITIAVVALGALALATPAQAHDDRHDSRHHRHHHHYDDGGRYYSNGVYIQQTPDYGYSNYGYQNDPNVTIAIGGHVHHHRYHHYYYGR